MAIVQFARFKGGDAEQIIKISRVSKQIFEKHGAEYLRVSRFHTGQYAGEWLVTTRYANWEVYGKVQEAVSKDADFAKVWSQVMQISELVGRNVAVSVDL